MCQCNVQNGTFSINQRDVRLKFKGKSMCSPAVVVLTAMERSRLTCNENRADFGAIFDTVFIQTSSNASFSLFVNSKDPFPGMVWLSVEPRGTSKLTCFAIRTQNDEEETTTQDKTGMKTDRIGNELPVHVVVITVLSVISLLLALTLILRTLRRIWKKHPRRRQKKDEQQTPQKASPEEEMFSPNSVRRSQDENVSEMSPMRQSSDTASPDVFEDALSEPPAERNIM